MSSRIANFAPPGSLFKAPRLEKPHKRMKSERVHDEDHLALIRKLPCLSCGMEPCGTAAHVRTSSAAHRKPNTGSRKPDDKWTVPLCHADHMDQHSQGELTFWHRLGLSPFLICEQLYKATGDLSAMRSVVMRTFRERQ